MKILLIVIDGLGDEIIPQLGNKTPLETAKTPNLDFLAKNGVCGLVRPFLFPWQKRPESESTHLALLGYDPKIYFLGRGPYEAVGIGIKLRKGEIALRVNFGTVDKNLNVIDRRAGRVEKTQSLIKALSGKTIEGVKFLIKKSWGHRAVLVLKGKNLSAKISNGDPKKTEVKPLIIKPKDNSKEAKFTARILNKFLLLAHKILKDHPFNKKREEKGFLPANYLLTRGAGMIKKTPSFRKIYGLNAGCIAGGGLYKGIAKILGMNLIKVKGATGFANTNLKGKFLTAKKVLKKYDFLFLHIKAIDTFSHDGKFQAKKKFIEKIDKNIKSILNLKNVSIVITADHSTCSLEKNHCLASIPILIYNNKKKWHEEIKKFCEKNCRKGKLGKIKQIDLMTKILELTKN